MSGDGGKELAGRGARNGQPPRLDAPGDEPFAFLFEIAAVALGGDERREVDGDAGVGGGLQAAERLLQFREMSDFPAESRRAALRGFRFRFRAGGAA